MRSSNLNEIEVRGYSPEDVRRKFVRLNLINWNSIREDWVGEELK